MRFLIPLVAVTASFAAAETANVNFLRDVAPIMSKTGCMSGTCHGAAKGKNGFKLSLRGYDPQFDYESLLYDMAGRRFNRPHPRRSLVLAKTSQEGAHRGRRRVSEDPRYKKNNFTLAPPGASFGEPATKTPL